MLALQEAANGRRVVKHQQRDDCVMFKDDGAP
jgi:hypothetical protein